MNASLAAKHKAAFAPAAIGAARTIPPITHGGLTSKPRQCRGFLVGYRRIALMPSQKSCPESAISRSRGTRLPSATHWR